MWELPSDTLQDTQQFTAKPNTDARIVAAKPYEFTQGNGYQWVSPRNIAIAFGGLAMLTIGAIAMRSTAINNDQPIKIAPLQNLAPSSQQVNKVILEGSKDSLADTKLATDLKLEEVTKAMLNERSIAILNEGKRQVSDRNSPCFKNEHQEACFIVSKFIPEQQKRYEDAALQRRWTIANHALFELKAARIALDGAPNVPFTPHITSAAIANELQVRVSVLQQSDNAIAAELYGGK